VLAPGYFSRQDTRTPVRIGVRAFVLGMLLNAVFVLTLLATGWAPPHAGLAAATTLASLFNCAWLLAGLMRLGVYRPRAGWRLLFGQVALACTAMGLVVLVLLRHFGDWYAMRAAGQIGALFVAIAGAGCVYFGACYLLGLRPRHFRLHAPV
jgi:putative peptidoglycan lipid II flippase